ncbi:MAG: CapA family protein, partial [Gemmatimonadota bacterium]
MGRAQFLFCFLMAASTHPAEANTNPVPAPVAQVAADTLLIRVVRICAGGDVLLGNNLDTLWAGRAAWRLGQPVSPFPSPDSLLAPLRPLVADADVVLLNIEGAIGEGPAPSKCRPGSTTCYAFRQPITVAIALAAFAEPAAVVGNVANNHALDAGLEGFHATIGYLAEVGVGVTGNDTLPTLVIGPAQSDTVAVLGFSTFRAGPDARDISAVR